ncbi:YhdP family protein [Uliginosibacterium sediminicola]|uniref:YhdP family protein n=1 Tax=Uliginosibacterium sediminicola TaxID=2024550 RepID=A0ABU9Z1U3_9RHOO
MPARLWRWRWCLHALRLGLHIPRTAGRWLWRVLLALWIVLAICFLIVRYALMPQVAEHRGEIETALSTALGAKVQISALEAHWHSLRPELGMRGLRIFDQAGREALELPRVDATIAWSSLLRWRLELYRLYIGQPELSVRREADGKIYVAGLLVQTQQGGKADFANMLLHQREILIDGARVRWVDRLRGAPELVFDKLSLQLENRGDSHRFALKASPAARMSGPLDLRGDLRGADLASLDNWRGALYVATDSTDLAVWRNWVDYPINLPRGRGGLRAWLNFEGAQTASVTADLALADVDVQFAQDLPMLSLHTLSGRLRLSQRPDGFSLAAERLTLATNDGLRVAPTQLSLRRNTPAGKPAGGELAGERLDVRVLAQLAAYLPLPATLRQRLQGADPHGLVQRLQASWQDPLDGQQSWPPRFNIDAVLDKLSLASSEGSPGVEGLSGSLRGSESKGDFALSVRDGALQLPAVFAQPRLALNSLQLRGSWRRDSKPAESSPELVVELAQLALSNPDITAAEFSGNWRSKPGGAGTLDLTGRVRRFEAPAVWRYIPLEVPQDTRDWLQHGLQSGAAENLRIRVVGPLDQFPFQNTPQATFRVEGNFNAVNLAFAPGWPTLEGVGGELLFDRVRMAIRSHRGRYRQVRLGEVSADLPNLEHPAQAPLLIVGRASGSGGDMLDYLRATPVAEHLGSAVQHMRLEGDGQLDLRIAVPLLDANATRVQGSYRADGNVLRIADGLPPMRQLKGTLSFSDTGIGPTQATAEFVGGSAVISGRTLADGTIVFDGSGTLPASGLRQIVDTPLWSELSGQTQTTARITITRAKADVQVSSDLLGIVSRLPSPLTKRGDERLPLRFGWSLGDEPGAAAGNSLQDWHLSLDGRAQAQWQDRCGKDSCAFLRGAIAVNDSLSMPARGMRVSGRFKRLQLDPWRSLLVAALAGDGKPSAPSDPNSFGGAVFQADEVIAGGHRFRNVTARAVQQDAHWVVKLSGPDIAGDLSWLGEGKGRLAAKLDVLRLQSFEDSTALAESEAQGDLPALDVTAEQFELHDMKLGKLSLHAENQGALWRLPQLRVESSDGVISGEGSSRRLSDGGRRTDITLKLNSDNVGGLLGRIGLPNALRKGKADLHGQLSWNSAPTSIDYPSLSGELHLDAEDGQFNKLDPGAARLLGILSLQSLPRRITLDFRDVFSEGFAFDAISGDFKLQRGQLYSNNLEVRGPAAKFFMKGSADIVNETQNLRLTVQPTLSEGFAVGIGAAALNPVVGVGVYVAQKVLRDPFEKLFSFDYSVTGSWSDPKVEKLTSASRAVEAAPQSVPPASQEK